MAPPYDAIISGSFFLGLFLGVIAWWFAGALVTRCLHALFSAVSAALHSQDKGETPEQELARLTAELAELEEEVNVLQSERGV
jgi:hypothetical protein